MNEFISVLQERQGTLLQAIWEHLQLSIIALLIAILIAVPLGLLLTRTRKVAEPIIGFTAVLQTIPSLAILAFLIPFLGIGTKPAVVALIVYALLPILRNTYTGVKEVNPALKEAATGMGMSSFRRLSRVELPLAMPVIMAGIRTSMVLIVGTTTIAALIGAGGLGELILLGIDKGGNLNLILLGAIPAALLAIILDVILRLVESTSAKSGFRSLATILIVSLLIVTTPFVFNRERQPDLVVGGKIGAEPAILMNMYKLLIEDETDLYVKTEPNLGKTDFVFEALKTGDIDIYPEFTGTAINTFLGEQAKSNDPQEVYQQAKKGMMEEYNMAFLQPMEFNNTYAVATTQKIADQYGLETIGDLKSVQDELVAGFTLEFKDRQDGYQGMKEVYNLDLNIETMEAGVRQQAIKSGEVDIIDAYATEGYMIEYNLKVLEDPKNLFPPYQGAPLMLQQTVDQYPELKGILNQLGGQITKRQMQEMNYKVDSEGQEPIAVARKYLRDNGYLE
ncbi:ABC transporter permease subunit [Pontibacillus yanchengensis]|uniref:ABC transporter permease subunit n=2 Tax=Pontibacillus yanchengensis TaxID=462910 RepID=A0A6I5A3E9_9BACI|nr:ABC transporter permease/substrate-binding protein [Pontibacillus yanchengensis]MYL33289.1 ABC transporter permease subunit [Pontibacillus yanchengensis]MYL51875.1 ABC transporter permease subunit [Pontibacillus yanchengensis]